MEQGHKKKTAVIVVASTEVVSGMLIVGITIAEAGNLLEVRLLTLTPMQSICPHFLLELPRDCFVFTLESRSKLWNSYSHPVIEYHQRGSPLTLVI